MLFGVWKTVVVTIGITYMLKEIFCRVKPDILISERGETFDNPGLKVTTFFFVTEKNSLRLSYSRFVWYLQLYDYIVRKELLSRIKRIYYWIYFVICITISNIYKLHLLEIRKIIKFCCMCNTNNVTPNNIKVFYFMS